MTWFKALAQDELPAGTQQVVKVDDRSILLVHHEGQLYALTNICPHMRLPLTGGKIKDHAIVCRWHHSAFDLTSGNFKDWSPWLLGVGRVLALVSKEEALPVFPTRVEDGSIWVEI